MAIEMHILEESLETIRVGEFSGGLGMRNSVWLLCGLIHQTKNVATIAYAARSQSPMQCAVRDQLLFFFFTAGFSPQQARAEN